MLTAADLERWADVADEQGTAVLLRPDMVRAIAKHLDLCDPSQPPQGEE